MSTPTQKDADQVLRYAFDDATNAIRVEGSTVSNPSVGLTGIIAPTSATEVGAINPGGNLVGLQTDASGNLLVNIASETGAPFHVIVDSSALPTGAATSANQTSQITQETAIATSTASIDGKTVHVDTGNVTVVSSALPTGASTSALQTTGNTSLSSINANQTNGTQTTQINGTVPLPTGASTSALQTTGNTSLASIDSKLTAPLSVTGPLTDTQLRATPVPVSGTVSATNSANGNTGSAVPAQATQVAGSDGTNLRALKVSATGVLSTDGSATTQPVSGSVTVTQATGTNLHTVVDSGTVSATQSGTWTVQPGNTANTTPWLATINQGGNSATVSAGGALKVDGSASTQPISGTVTANIGTTNGLALDASVTALQVSQSSTTSGEKGTLIQGAVTTAAPSYTTAQTNPLSLTTAGALRTDSSATTQPVSGTVTANAGTNLNTSALALDTSVNGLLVSQGSTTSGEKGTLIQGAVTTAAPSYTTAQTSPLSLTTSGALRVADSGGNPGSSNGRALANAPTVTTYSTPVTSAAYTTIIASTTSATNLVEIFDSSGVAIKFAVGAAAAEVDQFVIYPGGNGQVPLSIPAGSRISYKAVSTSASGASAFNVLNLYT